MREIKFRAWDNINHRMYYEDFYIHADDGITFEDMGQDHGLAFWDMTLMQFIGFPDKNGKEIYEGDIADMQLEGTVVRGVIKYNAPSFYLATIADLWDLDGFYWIKVIVNIHENSGLLEED